MLCDCSPYIVHGRGAQLTPFRTGFQNWQSPAAWLLVSPVLSEVLLSTCKAQAVVAVSRAACPIGRRRVPIWECRAVTFPPRSLYRAVKHSSPWRFQRIPDRVFALRPCVPGVA